MGLQSLEIVSFFNISAKHVAVFCVLSIDN